MKKVIKTIWSWGSSLLISLSVAILISVFIIQPSKVLGHSMDPTLHDNQRVFVSKLMHTFHYEPNYGDIVIIDSRIDLKRTLIDDLIDNPLFNLFMKNDREKWIKRVIGKPGDVIEFKNHMVFRNGKALNEPYINEQMWESSDEIIVVPDNHIFVLGDNRNHSKDSRVIGCIPISHVLGKKM